MLNEATIDKQCESMLTPGLILLNGHAATDQEHFGPLLTVTLVDGLEEAIGVANQTRYGLAAGFLSDDSAAFQYFSDRVRAGIVNWNSPTTGASGKLPFGGSGASGNHRPSGYFAADYCSYPVAMLENHKLILNAALPPGLQGIFEQ